MRDLKDDRERFSPSTAWIDAPIAKEWLDRAIDAEELAEKLSDELVKTIEKCAPDHSELLGYKEETDIHRASIQELSAQVDELQRQLGWCRWSHECPKSHENIVRHDQLATVRVYLEKLARLGNEPHYGNSVGNEIAKQALQAMKDGER